MELPAADHMLTDSEIESVYGDLLREAVTAFRSDPEYVIQMAQVAGDIMRGREKRRAYRERWKTDTESDVNSLDSSSPRHSEARSEEFANGWNRVEHRQRKPSVPSNQR